MSPSPRDGGISSLGICTPLPSDEIGVVPGKHGWERKQQCGSETEKQA